LAGEQVRNPGNWSNGWGPPHLAASAALDPAASQSEASSDAAPALAFRGQLTWITAGGGSLLRDTPVNPENQVLALPQVVAQSELRPDLRFEYASQLAAVVRPRLQLQFQQARRGGAWGPERSAASAEWIELYATWRLDERLALSYGLQSFQWGPAELVSPSNRIFHTTGFYRDPLYVVRGRHLPSREERGRKTARKDGNRGSADRAVAIPPPPIPDPATPTTA
jgi:hypothetical protein